jgi:hypothetical protein
VVFKDPRDRALLRAAVLRRLQRWRLRARSRSGPSASAGAGGVVVYWGVADANAGLKRLLFLGATERTNVQNVGEGIRVATVLDPFDNVFGVIEIHTSNSRTHKTFVRFQAHWLHMCRRNHKVTVPRSTSTAYPPTRLPVSGVRVKTSSCTNS